MCKKMKLDPYTIHANQFKLDKRLKYKAQSYKTSGKNIEEKLLIIGLGNNFLDIAQKAQATKVKINKGDYNKRLLHNKRNNKPKEKTTYT